MTTTDSLYVPSLPPTLKHARVFEKFDTLQQGNSFILINDHDPIPLYYQMQAERGATFEWKKIQNGPDEWKVEITKTASEKNSADETIGAITKKDIRKAEVFRKYGIDFCCGGKKTLQQACTEVNVPVQQVEEELNNMSKGTTPAIDFERWEADFLADYIYNQHHKYYYAEAPVITDLLDKVATKHGDKNPELYRVHTLYQTLQEELNFHFQKEEKILFPFIKAVVQAKKTGDLSALNHFSSLSEPIELMEADHEDAGKILAEIRKITNNYMPPPNSCNSFKFLYNKLEALENDLHIHVHLENNILFPKALAIEKELRK